MERKAPDRTGAFIRLDRLPIVDG